MAANRQHCRERELCARAGHPRAVGKARQGPTSPEQGRTRRRPARPPLRASQRIGGITPPRAVGSAHTRERESAQRKPTGRVSIIGTRHRRRRPTRALARERTAAEHATPPCRSARWRSRLADSSCSASAAAPSQHRHRHSAPQRSVAWGTAVMFSDPPAVAAARRSARGLSGPAPCHRARAPAPEALEVDRAPSPAYHRLRDFNTAERSLRRASSREHAWRAAPRGRNEKSIGLARAACTSHPNRQGHHVRLVARRMHRLHTRRIARAHENSRASRRAHELVCSHLWPLLAIRRRPARGSHPSDRTAGCSRELGADLVADRATEAPDGAPAEPGHADELASRAAVIEASRSPGSMLTSQPTCWPAAPTCAR